MAGEMNYTTLVNDVKVYVDRSDQPFVSQIPRLIAMAENRIAKEVHGLGYKKYVTDTLSPNVSVIQKPARWRETINFNVGIGSGFANRKFLLNRSYEYCRAFWPNPAQVGEPRFYGDYDYQHFLIVPTPALAHPFELVYHERPEPLSDSNQNNWTTEYAPDLILYATLLETQPFLLRDDRIQVFQAMYDRARTAISGEEMRRVTDESTSRRQAA